MIVNVLAVGDLAMQGGKASEAMVLALIYRNILTSASDNLTACLYKLVKDLLYYVTDWVVMKETGPLEAGHIIHHNVSNIRRTKSLNLNDSRLVLQLCAPNPLKPGVKSRMKM